MKLDRGTVVLVGLDQTRGHEQRGVRPCLMVSDPDVTEDQRYPLLCIVPLTGRPGLGALYPQFAAGSGGLRKRSFALLDLIRTVDKRRVVRIYGRIAAEELDAVDDGSGCCSACPSLLPFVRAGYSDRGGGALMERLLSTGIGFLRKSHDLFGLGLSWGWALSRCFAITPDSTRLRRRAQLENLGHPGKRVIEGPKPAMADQC